MDFDDLVASLEPPANRVGKHDGPLEPHLYEGAVMVAYAMHLLRTQNAGSHSPGWRTRQAIRLLRMAIGTSRLAERLAPRCRLAGIIDIALVGQKGDVTNV